MQLMTVDPVALVAAQPATHAEPGPGRCIADEVLVAAARFVKPYRFDADRQRAACPRPAMPGIDPGRAAREIDHAASAGRRGLRDRRYRQELHDIALDPVRAEPEAAHVGSLAFPAHAGLMVVDALAGVEQQRDRIGAARIFTQCIAGQPERILGFRLRQTVDHEPHAITRARRPFADEVERRAFRRTVPARAIGAEVARMRAPAPVAVRRGAVDASTDASAADPGNRDSDCARPTTSTVSSVRASGEGDCACTVHEMHDNAARRCRRVEPSLLH
jgi:hypothetical protein